MSGKQHVSVYQKSRSPEGGSYLQEIAKIFPPKVNDVGQGHLVPGQSEQPIIAQGHHCDDIENMLVFQLFCCSLYPGR